MRITIEGARNTPKWNTLEQALREMIVSPDADSKHKNPNGTLFRIARKDECADYRSPGLYELGFEYTRFSTREVEHITLEVK